MSEEKLSEVMIGSRALCPSVVVDSSSGEIIDDVSPDVETISGDSLNRIGSGSVGCGELECVEPLNELRVDPLVWTDPLKCVEVDVEVEVVTSDDPVVFDVDVVVIDPEVFEFDFDVDGVYVDGV